MSQLSMHLKSILSAALFLSFVSATHADDDSFRIEKSNYRTFGRDVSELAWSPDGTKIAVRGVATAYLWDLKDDEQIWEVPSPNIITTHGLAFSPDNNYVAFPTRGNGQANKPETYHLQTTITLISARDLTDTKFYTDNSFSDYLPNTLSLAAASDNSVLAAAVSLGSGWITLYNPLNGSIIGHVGQIIAPLAKPHPWNPLHIVLDGKHKILAGSFANGEVQTWDYEKNIKLADFGASKTGIRSIAINPITDDVITGGDGSIMGAPLKDGKLVVSQGSFDDADFLVQAWDAHTGKFIRNYSGIRTHSGVSSISVSPDGHHLAVGVDDEVQIYNVNG